MQSINIFKTILHILDNCLEVPVMSVKELDIENDISEFLEKHISRILVDGDLKKAYFNPDGNEMYNLCLQLAKNEEQFVEISNRMAGILFSIMKQNPDIPPGDVMFSIFEAEEIRYLSIIKFNYRNSYTHYVINSGDGNVNMLIKQKATLPGETQKVDECAIINFSTFEVKLLEKQYEICGDKEYYLSKYFLKCNSDLSYLQKMKILDKAAKKISKKHFNEDFEKVTQFKGFVAENLQESDEINIDKVADYVFSESTEIKKEYIEEVKSAGLVDHVVRVPETVATPKKFTTQKLKTDNGIEINFPSHFYNNSDVMEFINNPDGTISILIKNVKKS